MIEEKSDLTESEIEKRMNNAVRRALGTPPQPSKQVVGKTERTKDQRENEIRKATRAKPKTA